MMIEQLSIIYLIRNLKKGMQRSYKLRFLIQGYSSATRRKFSLQIGMRRIISYIHIYNSLLHVHKNLNNYHVSNDIYSDNTRLNNNIRPYYLRLGKSRKCVFLKNILFIIEYLLFHRRFIIITFFITIEVFRYFFDFNFSKSLQILKSLYALQVETLTRND